MKLINLSGPQDVVSLLMRRKWWIVLPFIALSAGVVLVTSILPQMYVSQSLIIIRPGDIPDAFVKDLIAGTTAERLSVISERVLSESNLRKVLSKFEEQLPEYSRLNKQDQIVKLRKNVDLQFSTGDRVKSGTQLPVSSFKVVFQNRRAEVAQKIVKEITDGFIEEDHKSRQNNVNATAEFMKDQVDDVAAKLATSDAKLKEVRSRRRNELQLEPNLRRLDTLTVENQGLGRDRTTLQLALGQLEQQLSQTDKLIPKPKAPVLPPPKDPKVEEYKAKLKELEELKANGRGDKWPEVQSANSYLEHLTAKMTPEQIELAKKEDVPSSVDAEIKADSVPNPVYTYMENNRQILQKQIADIEKRLADNDKTIATFNQHVNNAPQGEQELNDVLRENTELTLQYRDNSAKLAAAQLSASAENQQKGAQFQVQDPASLPLTPTKPAKSSILMAGFAVSFLFSLFLAFLVDILDQKAWSPSDIAQLIGVKVLVEIPRIATPHVANQQRRKKVVWVTSVGVAAVAYAVCLYLANDHPDFVLNQLDPLIQKLY